jgi:hypothetical protein
LVAIGAGNPASSTYIAMVKQARFKMTFDITEMSLTTSERCEAHFVAKWESFQTCPFRGNNENANRI